MNSQITQFLKEQSFHLVTTWPVLTEASHMLDFDNRAQVASLEWIYLGELELFEVGLSTFRRIINLKRNYDDVPMDLADATLVVAAGQLGIRDIIAIDSDSTCIEQPRRNRSTTFSAFEKRDTKVLQLGKVSIALNPARSSRARNSVLETRRKRIFLSDHEVVIL